MENKVIAKEYVDKNYVHKDVIREKIKHLKNNRNVEIQIKLLKELLEDK